MPNIAELLANSVSIEPHEAVAIAQQLIHRTPTDDRPAPLTPSNVLLDSDGSVSAPCRSTLSPSDLALLLQQLLPPGGSRVPGGLRYAIARALNDVDAPPYQSLEDFSRALVRYEQGSRSLAVKGLIDRGAPRLQGVAFPADPRRVSSAVTELRRELQDLEAELYEHRVAVKQRPQGAPATHTGTAFPLDRRRPSGGASELRRDLYEMEAQLYEQRVAALQAAASDRERVSRRRRLAGGLAVSAAMLGLIGTAGTFIKSRSAPARAATENARAATRTDTAAPSTLNLPGQPTDTASSTRAISLPLPPQGVGAGVPRSPGRPAETGAQSATALPVAPDSFSPSFESNGSAMFFHSGGSGDPSSALMSASAAEGDLHVMSIVDDGARNYHVQPSPDGRQIAFDSDRDGVRGVYIANRDGSNVRRVSGEGYAAVPTWAPDGRRLAYVRGDADNSKVWNLWLLNLASGAAEPLTKYKYGQTWGASWFKDNRRVAYTHEDVLSVLDLESGARREFRSPLRGQLLRTPAVSPSGRHIIFQVYRNGAWLLDLENGSMRRVLSDPTAEEFAWAPDGRRVAYHSRQDGQWALWVLGAPL